jgi:amidase
MARIGSLFSEQQMVKVRAGEAALTARIQSIFDDVDVVVTPGNATGPSRIGAYQRRGAISSLLLVSRRVPFFEIWNLTGQPAAAVPWALDRNGVPLSVQLVGRPRDEATLLALSAQIEATRPWAHWRPSVS